MADLDPIAPKPKKPSMPPIDLTLAVNFIPAVVCLCKTVLMSFSLSMLDPGEHLGGFVIFIMILNIDRAVSSARIFDENAVQCCILASWVINFLRSLAKSPKPVEPVATFLWLVFSYCLVAEPRAVQEFFVMYGQGSGGVFKRILPGILSSVFVMVLAFTYLNEEIWIVKSARSVGFACLCVAWVYVVSVWRPKPRHNGGCVFECHLLLSRFCPVLYVHWIVALLYWVGCVVFIVYHYIQIHVVKSGGALNEYGGALNEYGGALKEYGGALNVSNGSSVCADDSSLSEVKINDTLGNESVHFTVPGNFSGVLSGGLGGGLSARRISSVNMIGVEALTDCQMEEMTTIEEEEEDLEALFRSACQSRGQ